MKADELGQRTSLLLLPPKERIREVRRGELALVDNFANAIRTADIKAYAQSLEALQHSLLWPRVVRAVELSTHLLVFAGFAFGTGCRGATAFAARSAMISS